MGQIKPSDRLARCIEAGSVIELFPLLKNWTKEELTSLLEDIDRYCDELQKAIDSAHGKLALKPENFFNQKRASALDNEAQRCRIDAMGMCSEIASVAMYYLQS